jgi:hypothetical protein
VFVFGLLIGLNDKKGGPGMNLKTGKVLLLFFLMLVWCSAGAAAVAPENPPGFSHDQPSGTGALEQVGVEHLATGSMQANPTCGEMASSQNPPSTGDSPSEDTGEGWINVYSVISILAALAAAAGVIFLH